MLKNKLVLIIVFLSIFQNINATTKSKRYDTLLKDGTAKEISEVLSIDNDFYRTTFGPQKDTILMQAIKYDRPYEIIRLISQSGVRVNARNADKQDAVMYACAYSTQEKVIKYVIQRSTKPGDIKNRLTAKTQSTKSPLEYAESNPCTVALHVVKRFLGLENDDSEIIPEFKDPPLETEEKTEQPEETSDQEEKPAEEAVQEEELPVSETINYNKVYLFDYAPVDQDIEPEEVEEDDFYAQIPDPDKKDKNGKTALMLAAKDGNDWEVKSLIKSGAKINLQDKDGWTALMYAVRYQNNISLIENMLKNGADPKIKNRYGSNALQIASTYSNNPSIIRILLNSMNDDASEIFKSFILTITAGGNNPVTQIGKLKIFTDYGIPINRFYEGKTPLMYACEFGTSTEIIKLLLDCGAIIKVRTSDGKTAFNFAELNTHLEHNEIYWSLNGQ